ESPDFNDESDVISALSYVMPYFLEGKVKDLESTILPFIKLLFAQDSDTFKTQLDQELRSLIPNNDVRKLFTQVLWTLKTDCSAPQIQTACAKLISRTGLLMKLYNEHQDVKMSKTAWDTDQWKNDHFIDEDNKIVNKEKVQLPDEPTMEVPNYKYFKKLFVAVSVTAVVVILVLVFCLIK
ncbi:PREDICTED: leucine-rich repeat-containing protein 37A3-like, partial [Elephantulus edwardii]|uniref:leucine-rich repeat-containing protein 37A3-like n=1 Tax=Elephantulus edwardii TaxID=28737 RepID=UPI0003F07BA6